MTYDATATVLTEPVEIPRAAVTTTHPTPHLTLAPPFPATDPHSSRERRRARNAYRLTSLFDQRDDLAGISPVADVVVESVRWSV